MTDIVMLSGKQGSGKTTIANELMRVARLKKYDYAGTLKFAGTLYELHDYILNRMETLTKKRPVEKAGELLQFLGTDFGRKLYGDNVWVDILAGKIERNDFSGDFKFDPKAPRYDSSIKPTGRSLLVIDDCRFENEFDAIAAALRVRLVCPREVRKARADAWRDNDTHASEIGLDNYEVQRKFDMYLNTEGEALTECVSLIMAQLDKQSWKEKRNAV